MVVLTAHSCTRGLGQRSVMIKAFKSSATVTNWVDVKTQQEITYNVAK
jgi:ribosomal protein L39E